jgi:hypothetical protein
LVGLFNFIIYLFWVNSLILSFITRNIKDERCY